MEHYEYTLKNGKNLELTSHEAAFLRQSIKAQMNPNLPQLSPYSAPKTLNFFSLLRTVAAVLIVTLGTGGGVVFGAERAAPNSLLYPVKLTVIEPIARSFNRTLPEKVQFEEKILARRVAETELIKNSPVSTETKTRVATATKQAIVAYNTVIEKTVAQGRIALAEQSVDSVENILKPYDTPTTIPAIATFALSDVAAKTENSQKETPKVAMTSSEQASTVVLHEHLNEELVFLRKTRQTLRETKALALQNETQKDPPSDISATGTNSTSSLATTNSAGSVSVAKSQTATTPSTATAKTTAQGTLVVNTNFIRSSCDTTLATRKTCLTEAAEIPANSRFIRITGAQTDVVITQKAIDQSGRTDISLPVGTYTLLYIGKEGDSTATTSKKITIESEKILAASLEIVVR